MAEQPRRWRLIVQRRADKDLARLPDDVIRRVMGAIDQLADNAWSSRNPALWVAGRVGPSRSVDEKAIQEALLQPLIGATHQ